MRACHPLTRGFAMADVDVEGLLDQAVEQEVKSAGANGEGGAPTEPPTEAPPADSRPDERDARREDRGSDSRSRLCLPRAKGLETW